MMPYPLTDMYNVQYPSASERAPSVMVLPWNAGDYPKNR